MGGHKAERENVCNSEHSTGRVIGRISKRGSEKIVMCERLFCLLLHFLFSFNWTDEITKMYIHTCVNGHNLPNTFLFRSPPPFQWWAGAPIMVKKGLF